MEEMLKLALTQFGLGSVAAILLYFIKEIWSEYKQKDAQIKAEIEKREQLIRQYVEIPKVLEELHQVMLVLSKDINEVMIRVRMDSEK